MGDKALLSSTFTPFGNRLGITFNQTGTTDFRFSAQAATTFSTSNSTSLESPACHSLTKITKRIQINNLVPTPQPMTATLIFRRQLVRHKPDLLTASSTADKLPLEKFHRLLDLAFWGKF